MKVIAGYIALGVITLMVVAVVAATTLGLILCAPALFFLPKILQRPQRFNPSDEDLHAWIEGNRD